MTESERLTIKDKIAGNSLGLVCAEDCYEGHETCGTCQSLYNTIDRLAAYEDTGLTPEDVATIGRYRDYIFSAWSYARMAEIAQAESEGRLVVLPCKIGDTVYAIREGGIYEVFVTGFRQHEWDSNFRALLMFDTKKITGSFEYSVADFGKTWFLTQEDAEAVRGKKAGDG